MKRSPLLSLVVYVIAICTAALVGRIVMLIIKPVNPLGEVRQCY